MSFRRNPYHYILGSTLAIAGAASFFVLNKHAPFVAPVKAAELRRKLHTKFFHPEVIPETSNEANMIDTQVLNNSPEPANFLNPSDFVKCRVLNSVYETPSVKRLTMECPVSEPLVESQNNTSDIVLTHFIAREPEGSTKIVFPLFQNSSESSKMSESNVARFDILVQRDKMCKSSMFLHAIYPDEYCDLKGPFQRLIQENFESQGNQITEDSRGSMWDEMYGFLRKKCNLHEEKGHQRYFIASGPDGVAQLYSPILKILRDDQTQKRSVDNFLLISADSATKLPLLNELSGALEDTFELSKNGPTNPEGGQFYQYFTLSEPRWGWQGGYGQIDAPLLSALIGKKNSRKNVRRDISIFVAGNKTFSSDVSDILQKNLNFNKKNIHVVS